MADSYSKWVMTTAFANNLQASINSGNKIEWVSIKTSNDTHLFADLAGFNDTTLATASIKQTATINTISINGNTVTITAIFNNQDNQADYYIKTLFLVAKYNGTEFLAGATVANSASTAFRMPAASATEITEFTARPQITVSNSSTISATVDPVAAATNKRVDGLEATLQGGIDDINADKQSLWNTLVNYVTKAGTDTITGVKTFTQTIVGSITGNAGTATKLQTARKINGTPFDGSADIQITGSSALPVAGVYPTLADLATANPNHNNVYITTDNGNWNYWSEVTSTWKPGGVYQSAGIDYNVDGIKKYVPEKSSGAISSFDGTFVETSYAVFYTIDVYGANRLTFYSETFSSNYGYAFYDANGVFIPGSGLLERSVGYAMVDVPVMATTFKVTSRLETNQLVTLYYNNASVEVNRNNTELLKTTVYGNKKNLKSRYYQHDTKLISTTTGKYVKVNNSSSVLIPVSELGKAVKITGNTTNSSNFTFLKTLTGSVGDTPDYVTGYTGTIPLSLGQTKVIKVPSTAGYLFVSNTFDDGQIKQTYPSVISQLKDTVVTLAASNSSDLDKSRADFIGTGTNDELMFNNAITALVYGGTIKLLDGDYYIDSFPYHNNSAVYFENNGYARTINFEGSTENKSFLSDYGVSIHVTKTAFDSTVAGNDYNVFIGSETTIPIGVWQGLPNNVNFKNFYLFFDTSQKQMVGINGQYFGSMYIEQVGVYSKNYFNDRFDRHKPVTPAINSIGVISVGGANDEMARIGMDTVNVGGLGTGIIVARAEHLIMKNSTVSRSVIGYQFIGNSDKPLTLINNADEGNTHLPQFKGRGLITSIDFSIERLDADAMPDDPTGNTNPYAVEQTPGSWKGTFDYNIQGSALGIRNFWSPESGNNIKTRNINADKFGTVNPSYPDYLQEFYRTDLNKKVTYNGDNWRDANGNIV